jgi:uncharacterized RDD family membrane protein YckC
MKCPTCGYIGFESSDRCRNCGYEFALSTPTTPMPELSLQNDESGGPLRELTIRSAAPVPVAARTARTGEGPDLARVMQSLDHVLGATDPVPPELPLFDQDASADLAPLVSAAAEPRRPLAVRRATPEPVRQRPKQARQADPSAQSLDLPLPDAPGPVIGPARTTISVSRTTTVEEAPGAPPVSRALAALIDVALIAGIDAVVISFTLRLCGLSLNELRVLPVVPVIAFFLLVNGGYLALFTAAGGQTIGKMALGLKVVAQADLPVSAGMAVLRTLGCLISLLSLGIGFVPALLAHGGRAVEDRLADTRVVRHTG